MKALILAFPRHLKTPKSPISLKELKHFRTRHLVFADHVVLGIGFTFKTPARIKVLPRRHPNVQKKDSNLKQM